MAVTDSPELAARMRQMSLHGLSHDAWKRYMGTGSWDYAIEAPGFKYNLTDVAAAIGLHQLAQAEAFRRSREAIALSYIERLAPIDAVELPPNPTNRMHAWHLFPLRLRLDRLAIDRNTFFEEMRQRGIGCSVHWRPLHLHPYYQRHVRMDARAASLRDVDLRSRDFAAALPVDDPGPGRSSRGRGRRDRQRPILRP